MKTEMKHESLCLIVKGAIGIDVRYTRSRREEIVMAKACLINVLNRMYGVNTVRLGKLFGIHHSTAIHHIKNHSIRFQQSNDYYEIYNQLLKSCYDLEENSNVLDTINLINSTLDV